MKLLRLMQRGDGGETGACRKVRHKSRYCLDQINGAILEEAEPFLTVKMSVIVMWEFWHS